MSQPTQPYRIATIILAASLGVVALNHFRHSGTAAADPAQPAAQAQDGGPQRDAAHAPPKASTPAQAPAQQPQDLPAIKQAHAQPQPRSGGKLTVAEMRAWRGLVAEQVAASKSYALRLDDFARREPAPGAYRRLVAEQGLRERELDARLTVALKRIAEAHDSQFECHAAVARAEEQRRACGENLWAFDPKTGEIQLAPKAEPTPAVPAGNK